MSEEQPPSQPSDTAEAVVPRPALDKRKTVIGAVIGIVALALIFLKVIPQIGSYQDAGIAIQAMTAFDIALIVIAVLVYSTVYGFPFVAAVPGLSYPRSFQLNQGAFAISNGIPAGGAFGLGVQYAMLASYQVPPTVATAAIGATGVWSLFVTLALPLFGLAAIAASGTISIGPYVYIGVLGFTALIVLILGFALVIGSEPLAVRMGGWANAVARPLFRLSMQDPPDLVPRVLEFRNDTVVLVTRRWHVITVSQVAVSLCQLGIFFVALRGVEGEGTPTPFLVAFGAWAVAQIGIMIPITPGGLGTVDAFMIALLTAMGVSTGDATAATLVWRAASFVPQIAIGVLALVSWSRAAARTFASTPSTTSRQT